jgi:DNA-binding HxlR family transcriptional regulator
MTRYTLLRYIETVTRFACGERQLRVLALMGKRWTLPILVGLLQGPARFSELARSVPGLSERVMSERLQELCEAGLVERLIEPGPPLATTYRLTPAGERLRPALQHLLDAANALTESGTGSGATGDR